MKRCDKCGVGSATRCPLTNRAVGRRDAARVHATRCASQRHRARGARVRHGRVPARHAVFRIPAQAAGRHRAHRVPGPRGEHLFVRNIIRARTPDFLRVVRYFLVLLAIAVWFSCRATS